MPDENGNNNGGENGEQQPPAGDGSGKYNPASLEDAVKIIEALEKRLGERDSTIADLKKQHGSLAERLDAIDRANKKRLEEEGNWSEIAKQREAELAALSPYKERATALEQVIRESNEERIKRVPEDARPLIPLDYAPEKLQAWLNANEARLTKKPAPNYDAGAGGSGGNGGSGTGAKVTDADRRAAELASMQGFTIKPEDIAKRRAEMAQQNEREDE